MMNKLSKSKSIPLVLKSKAALQQSQEQIMEIDESQEICENQFGVRHKKIAEKYKIQQKNERPNYDIN
jgi:hypothetical protein